MNALWQIMETTDPGGAVQSVETILLSLLLAFVLGQLLAWAYCWTHSGLSYSRTFTQSLIIMTMVVSLVMGVIGNNIVTAFGLLGALALVRFRNVLKDTRDTVFVFVALVQGMAAGSERYATAVTGTLVILAALFYIHWTDFGSRGHFDGFLRFSLPGGAPAEEQLMALLQRFCRSKRPIAMQQSAGSRMTHCTYQVRLAHSVEGQDLVAALEQIEGMQDVSLVMQEEMSEV